MPVVCTADGKFLDAANEITVRSRSSQDETTDHYESPVGILLQLWLLFRLYALLSPDS